MLAYAEGQQTLLAETDEVFVLDSDESREESRAWAMEQADQFRRLLALSPDVAAAVPEATPLLDVFDERYELMIRAYEMIDYDVERLDVTRDDGEPEAVEIFLDVLESMFEEPSAEVRAAGQALRDFAVHICGLDDADLNAPP